MRKTITLCASLLLWGAAITRAETDSDVSAPDVAASAMKGTYVGDFGGHKITLCIDRIIGETVTGYSIVAGNERAFSGSFKPHEEGYAIVAPEPGDHAHDGVFKMIYARHGYAFKLADMRAHFEKQDWYMAVSQDITDKLTAREKKNAALIKRYENYGEEYYDSFGR